MCGIVGAFSKKEFDHKVLESMVLSIKHRGPDSQGYYTDGAYHVGMTRLSINDLETGDQPLYNADQSIVVLYNGEIYNYPQLKKELEARGHKFKTRSDGEVIAFLFEEYGPEAFDKLDGMFAISLWDKKNQRLYLVRDHLGEKPLYYLKESSGLFAFASEVKAFKKIPGIKLTLNKQAIWDYLSFLWVPEPLTIYEEALALMPGNMLIVDSTGMQLKEYKKLHMVNHGNADHEKLTRETRTVIEKSITDRLMADVEVGCFLSGGVDSSIITAIVSQKIKNLRTYTIGFEKGQDPYGGDNDESGYAESFAHKLGTNHTTIKVKGSDFKEALSNFVFFGDQPFAVSSGLGIYFIATKAHQDGIKVLLSGDGADEMFGGYSWYEYLNNKESGMSGYKRDLSFHNSKLQKPDRLRILNNYNSHKKAWGWHYYASEKEKSEFFHADFATNIKSSLRYFSEFKESADWDPVDYIKQDRNFYLPNEMLRKADRMGMAESIEIRVPFVAKSVLEHVGNLNFEDLIKGKKLKALLKDAFADVLTEDILNRPKHGFNVPIDFWLKNDWSDIVEKTFGPDSMLRKLKIISEDFTLQKVKDLIADEERIHGHTIFCFIILDMWLQQY